MAQPQKVSQRRKLGQKPRPSGRTEKFSMRELVAGGRSAASESTIAFIRQQFPV